MKFKTLLFAFAGLVTTGSLIAQAPIVIEGGLANAGLLEKTINGDTAADGTRNNPDQVYELKAGEFYLQNTAINVDLAGGTLTIRGQEGGVKPIWVKDEKDEVDVGSNQINGSLTLQNVYYQNMQMSDRALPWAAFNLNADSSHLLVEDCVVEFCNGIIFNMNSVSTGAEAVIRNNYFRDFQLFTQWWASRVLQHKVPTDILIFENNTVSGGGLTLLAQESLTEYAVINHNTFINNHKYVNLNQYWKECYFTNNLFVNANMVGEDMENVATGGQDPDGLMHGLTGVDTITGLRNVWIQGKFYVGGPEGDSTEMVEGLGLDDIIYYAADNVVTYSPTLDAYYNGTVDGIFEDAPASYLEWSGLGMAPYKVVNVPGIWQNSRTEALVADHSNLVDENNEIYTITLEELGLGTDPLPQAAADSFVQWNRNQWGVPDITTVGEAAKALYAFGDYDPQTLPGIETENGTGITKISDLLEDFSYTMDLKSKSDGLRIGALHWNDEAFDGEASLAAVKAAYEAVTDVDDVLEPASELGLTNYPNPFKSSTTIRFNLEKNSRVNLAVYDISGRKVEVLINENRLAGEHTVNFAPASLGNSIYFIRLTTEDNTVTKRMMMLK